MKAYCKITPDFGSFIVGNIYDIALIGIVLLRVTDEDGKNFAIKAKQTEAYFETT